MAVTSRAFLCNQLWAVAAIMPVSSEHSGSIIGKQGTDSWKRSTFHGLSLLLGYSL